MSDFTIHCLPLGELQANAYIIPAGAGECIIVDPGDDVPTLVNQLQSMRLVPKAVFLTHGHFDHILGAAHIKELYGASVYISEGDKLYLEDTHYNLCPDYAVTPFKATKADVILFEGDTDILGIPFTILSVPGHTPGGLCLYHRETGSLLSGDTLFSNGFGRTDLIGGNMAHLFQSIKRLFQLPPETMVYPGHGPAARMGDIRKGFYR